MGSAIEDICAERQRQIEKEGWSAEHDDAHTNGELPRAAACYALSATTNGYFEFAEFWSKCWPWARDWWKPFAGRRRNLVKAAALIVAEIERLDRTLPPPSQKQRRNLPRTARRSHNGGPCQNSTFPI